VDAGIVTAVVTAAASLVVSVLTAILAYGTRIRGDARIAQMQSRLTEERESRNAKRDYEYDARKRLYTELQPLLFQLSERSARALDRIRQTFAEGSRDDSIKWPGRLGSGWENDEYHMQATVWDLFVPLALVRCIQRKLTIVDLTVDSTVRWQYLLASELFNVWTKGSLASEPPQIKYHAEDRHERQHVLSGHLEHAVDLLLQNDDGTMREAPISYATFQARFFHEDFVEAFEYITVPLTNAHAGEKRVLWRILLVQIHLYSALIQTFNSFMLGDQKEVHPADAVPPSELESYMWRTTSEETRAMQDPDIDAARAYLRSRFPTAA
jgi:hypothetical protein